MTSALEGGGWSAPRPGRFTPGKTRYPLYRRLGGPQGRSGRVRKISSPSGFDPRSVQPVSSRYTDNCKYVVTLISCYTGTNFIYHTCSHNLCPRVFCAPYLLRDDIGFISRTIVLFIYQSSHYLLHKDILNTVLQHCCLSLKILTNIDKTYRILSYTRIKPRSRHPQKKSAYFTHPDFSVAKLAKKSAQTTRVNTVILTVVLQLPTVFSIETSCTGL